MKYVILAVFLLTQPLAHSDESKHPKTDILLDEFYRHDIKIENVHSDPHDAGSPVPNVYEERVIFSLGSVAPKGGQIFVCTRQRYADSIYAYYDALQSLAGPYLYKSKDGLVVAQLNSGLSIKEAEQIEEIINNFEIPIE